MKHLPIFKRAAATLLAWAAVAVVHATHLVGGNLGYTYVGETSPGSGIYRYTVYMEFYLNCGDDSNFQSLLDLLQGTYSTPLEVGCYIQDPLNPGSDKAQFTTVDLLLSDSLSIIPDIPDGCTVGDGLCTIKGVFTGTLDVPLNTGGYHLYFQMCCRNLAILNIDNPNGTGIGYYAFMPPPLVHNSSPVWLGIPTPFLCTADTATFLNAASDPDGDQLIFSFEIPYNSHVPVGGIQPPPPVLQWPVPEVTYDAGFSLAQPFGAGGYSYINGSTGLTEYQVPIQGNYVVAVEVKEYRFGQLIGRTRRDLQLQVIPCPPNLTPEVDGVLSTYYEVNAGDLLCFDMSFLDADGDSLFLIASGTIFDGGLFSPPATIGAPDSALASISTTFCWDTQCDQGQLSPYLFSVSVSDDGCPPKTVDVVIQVQVNPFLGPQDILGPDPVCTGQTGASYTTDIITGAGYTWGISGGTIISGQGTGAITVDWGAPGIGILTVFATDTLGCPSAPISLSVTIAALPFADAGADVTTCPGTIWNLGGTPTGPPGSSYLWSPGADLDDPTSPNPNATPPPGLNTYIVQVSNGGCVNTDTVLVLIYVGNVEAGPDASICSGDTVQLHASGGLAYSWSPGLTLSDSLIADPFAFPPGTITYSVDVTDSAGCIVKELVTITVNLLPQVDAGLDTSVCDGQSVVIGGSPTGPTGSTYVWLEGTTLIDSVANPLVTPTTTTTYTVQVTDPNGCVGLDVVEVTLLPAPAVDAGSDLSLCVGDSVQLQGSGAGDLQWSPSTSLSNDTIPVPIAGPASTTTYTLTVTDGSSCTSTDQVTVFVNELPLANAGSNVALCNGDTIQLQASGGATYVWSPSLGLSDPNVPDPLAFPTTTTTYIVTVTDTSSCSAQDAVIVTVNEPADAGIDGGAATCSDGSPLSLFALLGGTPDIGGTWTPPNYVPGSGGGTFVYVVNGTAPCPNDTSEVVIVENLAPDAGLDALAALCTNSDTLDLFGALGGTPQGGGTWVGPGGADDGLFIPGTDMPGIYTYTITGIAPCTPSSAAVTVTVDIAPNAGISATLFTCTSGVVFNMLDSLGGTPDPGGTWLDPSSLPHGSTFDPANDDPGTYTYTVSGSGGCLDGVVTLTINAQEPDVQFTGDDIICTGDTTQIIASGGTIYSWDPPTDLSDPNIPDPLVFPTSSSVYIVTVTDGSGCIGTGSITVIVNPLPQADAGPDIAICEGGALPIGGSPTGPTGSTYVWSPAAGLSDDNAANPSAFPTSSTSYVVTVTDLNLCLNTDSVNVTVNPLPTVDAGPDTSICAGGSVQLAATGSVPGDFSWTPITGLDDPTSATPIASPSVTITYTVTLTDSNNCPASDAVQVIVNSLPTADAGPDVYVCPGFDVQLNGSGGGSYSWQPAAEVDDPTSATPQASPPATTIFVLTVTDGNGCTDDDQVTVTVNDDPQVDAGPDQSICVGETVQIGGSPTSVIPGASFQWSPVADLDDPSAANPNATPPETITYTVTVTSDTCTNSDQMTITVQGIAQAEFNVRLEPNCDGMRAFFNDLSSGAVTYAWDFNGDGITDSDMQNPQSEFPYASDIVVTLTITDIFGCTGSITHTWPVGTYEDLVDILVPNVFTPNNDGENDVFTIETEAMLGACTDFFIFNRWGQKVFESFGGDIVWSGRNFAGAECSPGTYFYVIRVKDIEFKGNVYLNKMIMRGITAATVALTALLSGCTGTWGIDCVQGTSAPVAHELELAPFTGIVSEGSMEVTLTRGDAQHVVATGPEEILDLIKTDVTGGVWHIDLKKCYSTSQPLRVDITIPELDRVEVDGSGNVFSSSTFEPEQLELSIHGSGNISLQVNCKSAEAEIAGSGSITLGGTCASFEVEIAGSGDVHAADLSTSHTKASIAGSGDMEVTAVETLKADIAGSGDVRYKGRPEVTSNIAGSGSVTPLE